MTGAAAGTASRTLAGATGGRARGVSVDASIAAPQPALEDRDRDRLGVPGALVERAHLVSPPRDPHRPGRRQRHARGGGQRRADVAGNAPADDNVDPVVAAQVPDEADLVLDRDLQAPDDAAGGAVERHLRRSHRERHAGLGDDPGAPEDPHTRDVQVVPDGRELAGDVRAGGRRVARAHQAQERRVAADAVQRGERGAAVGLERVLAAGDRGDGGRAGRGRRGRRAGDADRAGPAQQRGQRERGGAPCGAATARDGLRGRLRCGRVDHGLLSPRSGSSSDPGCGQGAWVRVCRGLPLC